MKSKIIVWIKDKKNISYVLILILGIVIASFKYSFIPAIIGFGVIVVFGLVTGFIIKTFIK